MYVGDFISRLSYFICENNRLFTVLSSKNFLHETLEFGLSSIPYQSSYELTRTRLDLSNIPESNNHSIRSPSCLNSPNLASFAFVRIAWFFEITPAYVLMRIRKWSSTSVFYTHFEAILIAVWTVSIRNLSTKNSSFRVWLTNSLSASKAPNRFDGSG